MTKVSRPRVYRMTLAQFHKYLTDKRAELEACIQEISEIEARFRKAFQEELVIWQDLFTFCYPRVKAERRNLPADLQAYLDRLEAEEEARIRGEIEALYREIAEKRQIADGLTQRAQKAAQAMRAANPSLNAREEELKARVAQLQEEFTRAFEEEEALRQGALGALRHIGRIRRLRALQKTIKQQQAEALKALRAVRKEWTDTVQATAEKQSTWREEWQKTSVRLAEAQGQRDYLSGHLKELAEEAGLQRALQEMTEMYTVPGELGEKLAELAWHNAVRRSFEEGLQAIAEALGLLKGLSNGLDRFTQSVGKVLAEQRRYNLKPVQVPVPEQAVNVNALWADLRQKVKDERYLGANPLEFIRLAREEVIGRLPNETIQAFFEGMGNALNEATKAWG